MVQDGRMAQDGTGWYRMSRMVQDSIGCDQGNQNVGNPVVLLINGRGVIMNKCSHGAKECSMMKIHLFYR